MEGSTSVSDCSFGATRSRAARACHGSARLNASRREEAASFHSRRDRFTGFTRSKRRLGLLSMYVYRIQRKSAGQPVRGRSAGRVRRKTACPRPLVRHMGHQALSDARQIRLPRRRRLNAPLLFFLLELVERPISVASNLVRRRLRHRFRLLARTADRGKYRRRHHQRDAYSATALPLNCRARHRCAPSMRLAHFPHAFPPNPAKIPCR